MASSGDMLNIFKRAQIHMMTIFACQHFSIFFFKFWENPIKFDKLDMFCKPLLPLLM